MSRIAKRLWPLVLVLVAAGALAQASRPDTIFTGEFVTLDPGNRRVSAIAVRSGRIVASGDVAAVDALRGPATRIVKIPGVAVPGWVDAHVHVSAFGKLLSTLNVQAMNKAAIADAVAAAVAKAAPGDWITGGGWDEGFFDVAAYPTVADLDAVSPANPVLLRRIGSHSVWVNSRALELAGIDADTPDPAGGRIVRGADGRPTGMLLEQAEYLATAAMPDMDTPVFSERYIRAALDQYRRWGLTGVHDAGSTLAEIRIFKKLMENGELPLRIYAMAIGDEAQRHYLGHGPEIGLGDGRLTVRSFKIYIDGALGARGAQLSQPYADDPSNSGLQQMSDAEIDAIFAAARQAGFQVNGHVIGDLGVRRLLDAIERNGVRPAERFRLEHASIIAPADLPRFRALGVVASMQPVFIGEYQRWGVDRVGPERAPWIMPIGDLVRSGAHLATGTDYPASDSGDPRTTLNGLVTRTGYDGKPAGGWFPAQAVDVRTALAAMSAGNAYAAFREDDLGALTEGRYADFTVLSEYPAGDDPRRLLDLEVLMTVVGGKITFRAGD